MFQKYLGLFVIIFVFFPYGLYSQSDQQKSADSILNKWGEMYFKFNVSSKAEVDVLTRIISIDNFKGNEVFAYANHEQFEKFLKYGYKLTILPNPGSLLKGTDLIPESYTNNRRSVAVWNFYPTYQQYVDTMLYFASAYPEICRLDTIGTSVQNRLLLALKISDNVNVEEGEPEFLYTSSMHGDETTGYILMLHLIDSLLTGYEVSPRITDIVNNTEIYINPLANPDGTYNGGNNTVYGAIRYNANGYDLNRNYPDPTGTYTGPRQKETLAFMNYADEHNFVMAANFHGGAEVFNYPWDCWYKLTADDDWWYYTGREYADTVHVYSAPGYFTFLNNGVTNGAQWYQIFGGRQDYMNYFKHCREVTIELSNEFILPVNKLISRWNYNYHSLLNYIERVNYGFQGIITDTATGEPLLAKVFISGHDKDSSWMWSKLPSGFYSRPIFEGNYNVTFSATGYFSKTIPNVTVSNLGTTILDIQLKPITYGISSTVSRITMVFPNPNQGNFKISLHETGNNQIDAVVYNLFGELIITKHFTSDQDLTNMTLDMGEQSPGIYFLHINNGKNIYMDKILVR